MSIFGGQEINKIPRFWASACLTESSKTKQKELIRGERGLRMMGGKQCRNGHRGFPGGTHPQKRMSFRKDRGDRQHSGAGGHVYREHVGQETFLQAVEMRIVGEGWGYRN